MTLIIRVYSILNKRIIICHKRSYSICCRYRMPLAHVNQAGGQAPLLYEGRSLLMDAEGRLRALAAETDGIADRIDGFQANICLNYGGRDEIVRAARRWAEDAAAGRADGELTEELFSRYLYSANVPDPDLLIRPGGEQRLSNFLLWQCAYAEFYFTDVLWPDFTKEELDKAIEVYRSRDRRYGGVK